MSFTSDLVHSMLITVKTGNRMFSILLSEAIGVLKQYLLGPHQGHAALRSNTLQALQATVLQMGRLGASTGHTVITFGLEHSKRHNSAQL